MSQQAAQIILALIDPFEEKIIHCTACRYNHVFKKIVSFPFRKTSLSFVLEPTVNAKAIIDATMVAVMTSHISSSFVDNTSGLLLN